MAAKPAHTQVGRHAARPRRHRLFLPSAAAVIMAVLVAALAIAIPSARAGDVFQPYQGSWDATSQGVNVAFTGNQANVVWVTPKGACPLSAKVKFTVPTASHVIRGAVRSVSKCVAKAHMLKVGQRVVVMGNPATHHLRLTPTDLQTLFLCRSAKDGWCKNRG